MHWAARNGHVEVCRWLFHSCGVAADVPALKGGDTPFMLAAWMGHVEVCSFLVLEAGADPRHVNNWGCNAWHKACRMDGAASSVDMLRFLQQQEVDPCVVNCNGHSPLHKTALHGATAAAEFMRTETKCCGRGQVAPDLDGMSPSAIAFVGGHFSLASKLRHLEDVLWLAPVVFSPLPPPAAAAAAAAAAAIGGCDWSALLDAGLDEEARLFRELESHDQSRALQYAFFAERGTCKEASEAKPREVRSVGVVGSGTMGCGIAMALLDAKPTGQPQGKGGLLEVVLVDQTEEAVLAGKARIEATYRRSRKFNNSGDDKEAQLAEKLKRLTVVASGSSKGKERKLWVGLSWQEIRRQKIALEPLH